MLGINMAMKKENIRLLLIAAVVLIVIGSQNTLSKRAVADVEGQACVEDKDCPCFGEIKGTDIKSFGIGTASCREDTKTCDTSLCIDIQPVASYLKDNPFQWIKDNIVLTLGIMALLISVAFWPKQ